MKESEKLKINLINMGNLLVITLSLPAITMIVIYTYNLFRPGFTFRGEDWFAYIMSFAVIGLAGWFARWGSRKQERMRARDAEATPKPDVTEIRRKK